MRLGLVTDAWEPQVNGVVRTLMATLDEARRIDPDFEVDVVEPGLFRGVRVKALAGLKLALPPFDLETRFKDITHLHIATEGPLGFAAKRLCDSRGWAYTTAFHTNFPDLLSRNYRIPEGISFPGLRWFHARSKAVLVPTPSMIRRLEARGFESLVQWGRGVDATFRAEGPLHPAFAEHPRPHWLNVGRVSLEKNLDAFLALDLPGTKFVVGDGPDRERLERVFPQTVFLGQMKGETLATAYRAADVFVFPSRFDTFGLVNIEAIACGTPVAAFPVTGPIDIVTPQTGALDADLTSACWGALRLGRVAGTFSWRQPTEIFLKALVPLR